MNKGLFAIKLLFIVELLRFSAVIDLNTVDCRYGKSASAS